MTQTDVYVGGSRISVLGIFRRGWDFLFFFAETERGEGFGVVQILLHSYLLTSMRFFFWGKEREFFDFFWS